MEKTVSKYQSLLIVLISMSVWLAVGLQLYFALSHRLSSLPESVVRFFSYFTIQTNILVGICFTFLWLMPKSKWGHFFKSTKTVTAITLYILIVGLVYNFILRFQWHPQGLEKVADELLHTLNPLLVLLYWLFFVNKNALQFKFVFLWLVFPGVYLVYTIIRGYFFHFYPYPFMDVNVLGLRAVMLNSIFMLIAFLVVGFVLTSVGKISNKN